MTAHATYEQVDRVAVVTMDDGKANAFGPDMIAAVNALLDRAAGRSRCSGCSPGDRGCSREDSTLKVIRSGDAEAAREMRLAGTRLMMRLYGLRQPLVIAATGHAIALGAFCLLTADYRIGSRGDFRTGLNENRHRHEPAAVRSDARHRAAVQTPSLPRRHRRHAVLPRGGRGRRLPRRAGGPGGAARCRPRGGPPACRTRPGCLRRGQERLAGTRRSPRCWTHWTTSGMPPVRVVELGSGFSAAYAAKLLGDYGADVVKVEEPGGDESRRRGPFPENAADAEKSGAFLALNVNKRGVCLDLAAPEGRRKLDRLIAWGGHPGAQLPAIPGAGARPRSEKPGRQASRPGDAVHHAVRHPRPLSGLSRQRTDRRPRRRLGRPVPWHPCRGGPPAAQGVRPPVRDDDGHRRGAGGAGPGAGGTALRPRRAHRPFRAGVHGVGARSRHPCLLLPRCRDEAHPPPRADSLGHLPGQGCADLPDLRRAGPMAAAGGVHGQPGLGAARPLRRSARTSGEPGHGASIRAGVRRREERRRPLPRGAEASHLRRAGNGLCGAATNEHLRERGFSSP